MHFLAPENLFRNILWYVKDETKFIYFINKIFFIELLCFSTYLTYISYIFLAKKNIDYIFLALWPVIQQRHITLLFKKRGQSKEKHCHAIKCDCESFHVSNSS